MPPPRIRKHGKTPKVRRAPRTSAKITPEQLEAIRKELELLPGLIRTHYTKWTNGAKDFQLECMGAQKLGKDVLLHASTGAGKTGIAAGSRQKDFSTLARAISIIIGWLLAELEV
ncbi:hypothetical protein B0H14DRAFT_2376860 [Mycena olivaceomarginata]|nr:hypothetical protein B0H14DRAFT_2376860 [Mycena olivaceomarginata]